VGARCAAALGAQSRFELTMAEALERSLMSCGDIPALNAAPGAGFER